VAYTQADELRVSSWNSTHRLRAGTKHLCGQTCLHKLMDDFMAGKLTTRAPNPAAEAESLIDDEEPSRMAEAANPARELMTKMAAPLESSLSTGASALASFPEVATLPRRNAGDSSLTAAAPHLDDSPNYGSRRWRADAWQRERERELRSAGTTARRKNF
jgi:hypothetical protein